MIVNGEGGIELVTMIKKEDDESSWETISETEVTTNPLDSGNEEGGSQNDDKCSFDFLEDLIAEEKLNGTYPDIQTGCEMDEDLPLSFDLNKTHRPTSPDSEGFPLSPEWSDNEYEHVVECEGSTLDTESFWEYTLETKRKRKKERSKSAGYSKKSRKTKRSGEKKKKLSSAFKL